MHSEQEVRYRLKLVQGFLEEAQQDVSLKRWRSAVDNSQLVVENAGKAVLSLFGPIGRTHNPSGQIWQALNEGRFAPLLPEPLQRLAELGSLLGADIHSQTDYGMEATGRTPWELFGESDAQQALAIAEEAAVLAHTITKTFQDRATS